MKALLTEEDIKRLALENGFKLKQQPSGEMELNPYVYDFARALIDAAKSSEKEAHESDDGLHDKKSCDSAMIGQLQVQLTAVNERLKSLEQENEENLSIIESIANGLSENPISLCKGVMHGRNVQLSKIATENKIEGIKLVLQNERIALNDKHLGFGIRVDSIEAMLRELEVELNAVPPSETP